MMENEPTTRKRRRWRLPNCLRRPSIRIITVSCISFLQRSNLTMTVTATVPPNPDLLQEGYENVFQERRRLGVDYKYTTKWLSPELCRNVSVDVCKVWDEKFGKTVEKNQQFLTPYRRRRLIQKQRQQQRKLDKVADEGIREQDHTNEDIQEGSKIRNTEERREEVVETLNGMKALVMLLQWSDHDKRLLLHPQQIEVLFNSDEIDQELIPTGSVRRYFNVNSYGQFTFAADIVPWIKTDNSEAFYASLGDSGRTPEVENAFLPLLNELDGVGSSGFDFSPYDADGDNIIDMVIFLHSGYAAELGGEDCDSFASSSMRIASHASSSIGSSGWRSKQGYELGGYVVTSAFRGTCGSNIARLGTIVHETSHLFGLPDLYDLDGPMNPSGNVGGLGNYDIMSNPNGQMNSQARPGHFSAWSKTQLGWVQPIEIDQPGEYTLRPVEIFPDVYRIRTNFQYGEYLLLENRQPIPGDFDERFWAPGGVVVYHVNENNMGLGRSNRGGPFQDDWPLNGNHYGIAVLQRDGGYELEQAINGGHHLDFFYESDHVLGPGNGEVVADNGPYPNTDSYAFGVVQNTGIKLRGFRLSSDGQVTFQVVLEAQSRQIVIESESPTVSPSSSFAPTETASQEPSLVPTETITQEPSMKETESPTQPPFTSEPTVSEETSASPTMPEGITSSPTQEMTAAPSIAPIDEAPTPSPSAMPDERTRSPSLPPEMTPAPIEETTLSPSAMPDEMTRSPTESPEMTPAPIEDPTLVPTAMPEGMTSLPTQSPEMTPAPVEDPTLIPTTMPEGMTTSPTQSPEMTPAPIQEPTAAPTPETVETPAPTTNSPTKSPTLAPQTLPSPPPEPTNPPSTPPPNIIPPISRPTTVGRPSVHEPSRPSIYRPPPYPDYGKGGGKGSKKTKTKKTKGYGKGKGGGRKKIKRKVKPGKGYRHWYTTRTYDVEVGADTMRSFGIVADSGRTRGSNVDLTRQRWRRQPDLSSNSDSRAKWRLLENTRSKSYGKRHKPQLEQARKRSKRTPGNVKV